MGEREGHQRVGDWIQTASGRAFWPLDPRPGEIDVRDVAAALSRQCRFAGHLREEHDHYSVAEHSVRVSLLVEKWVREWNETVRIDEEVARLSLWGLLHDASEAYLVDLPRPIKRSPGFVDGYLAAERRLMAAVCARFDLPAEEPEVVKRADNALLLTEARDLLAPRLMAWREAQAADASARPLDARIDPWTIREARRRFLGRFVELGGWLT